MYERRGRGGREEILEILKEDGRGEGWMKRLQRKRKKARRREERRQKTIDEYERERECKERRVKERG